MLPRSLSNLFFDQPIHRWDEAIPLGNGLMGALIWGDGNPLKISLDRVYLWDKTRHPNLDHPDYTFDHLLDLVEEGRTDEIDRFFEAPYLAPTPTKLPAGRLEFHFGDTQAISSALDLATAEASVTLTMSEDTVRLKSFCHAVTGTGFLKIEGLPDEREMVYSIRNPQFNFSEDRRTESIQVDSVKTSGLDVLTYPAPELSGSGEFRYYLQRISETFSYGIFTKEARIEDSRLLVYRIVNSNDGDDLKALAEEFLDFAIAEAYEAAFESHKEWWRIYWEQSGLRLSDPLFEKNWYLAQYFLGSASRKGYAPMPLQGVWTADDGNLPPWKGDYHHDLNTQFAYSCYLKANHREEGETFLDFLWDLQPKAREFAGRFYGARAGASLPTMMTIDGDDLSGWVMYAYSLTSQIWLCQLFERHGVIYGDKEFLRNRTYPYMKETAEFILSMVNEVSGRYILPASASPEVHDNSLKAWFTPNTNYDLSLMRWLFLRLSALSQSIAPEETDRWQTALSKLPSLGVNEKGVLKLSPDEELNESHRHFSHLMAIHPLRLLDYNNPDDKRIIDASILDLERLGSGLWVGFSFAWMSQLYSIARNGEGAAFQLELFWRHTCSPNGFHLNGDFRNTGITIWHYRPFTLEANFFAADALQEMLLYSHNGEIELFPALPRRLNGDVSFQGFMAEQGLEVSAQMENGVVTELELKAHGSMRVKIRNWSALKHLADSIPGKLIEETEDCALFSF
jgi:alpha-L-fucosidase 2